jgi:hypothetical protein
VAGSSGALVDGEFDIAEHEARARMLRERLSISPIVDLIGVVGAVGPCGGQSRGETNWTMRFNLEAWRIGAAEMQVRRMSASKQVSTDELHLWQERIEPFSVIRARARVVDDPEFGRPEARLEEIITLNAADEQLGRYAQELQVPVTFEDSQFGTLILDRRIDAYRGKAIWNGAEVEISIHKDETGEIEGGLRTLRQLWQDQEAWAERIGNYAVERLLRLKNDNWLDEDEAPLSAEEFKSRMCLDRISIDEEGLFTFWHNDGDMFWGHCIEIRGNLRDGPTFSDIPG